MKYVCGYGMIRANSAHHCQIENGIIKTLPGITRTCQSATTIAYETSSINHPADAVVMDGGRLAAPGRAKSLHPWGASETLTINNTNFDASVLCEVDFIAPFARMVPSLSTTTAHNALYQMITDSAHRVWIVIRMRDLDSSI